MPFPSQPFQPSANHRSDPLGARTGAGASPSAPGPAGGRSCQPSDRQPSDHPPGHDLHITGVHLFLALLPGVISELYWKFSSRSIQERRGAAVRDGASSYLSTVLRCYGLRDETSVKLVVSAWCARKPLTALKACADFGVKDSAFVGRYAELVSTPREAAVACSLMRKLSLRDEQRLVLAERYATLAPVDFARHFSAFKVADGRQQYRLLKIAAMNDQTSRPGAGVVRILDKAFAMNEHERFDLLLTVAAHHPSALACSMGRLAIQDPDLRKELLLAASRGHSKVFHDGATLSFACRVADFHVEDSEALFEAALVGAKIYSGDIARNISAFGLSAEQLKEVARVASGSGRDSHTFLEHFEKFGIREEAERREIGRRFALANSWLHTPDLDRLGFSSVEHRRELAQDLTHAFGLPTRAQHVYCEVLLGGGDQQEKYGELLYAYGFTPLEAIRELLPIAARYRPHTAVEALHDLGLGKSRDSIAAMKVIAGESPEGVSAILLGPGLGLPRDVLRRHVIFAALGEVQDSWLVGGGEDLIHRGMNILRGVLESQSMLGLSLKSEAEREGRLSALLEMVRSIGEGEPRVSLRGWDLEPLRLSLPAALYAVTAQILAEPLTLGMAEGARVKESIRLVSGLSELPIGELSRARLQQLLEVLGACHFNQRGAPEAPVAIAENVWRSSFTDALDLVAASHALCSLREGSAQGEEARKRTVRDTASLAAFKETIVRQVEETFASDFGVDSARGIVELRRDWGDIFPLSVLMARFKAGHALQLPMFQEIVGHVCAGTFYDWKYDTTFGQLSSMTPGQVQAWRENPARVSYCTTAQALALSERKQMAEAQEIVESKLLPLIPEAYAERLYNGRGSLEEIAEVLDLPAYKFVARTPTIVEVVRDVATLVRCGDRATLFAYVKRYGELKDLILPLAPADLHEQITTELRSLTAAVRERVVSSDKGYVVFSTVADHPKLLLTVGDLVNVSSCLNYRSGSALEALPSYVVDSNIKLSLSFVIAEHRLRSLFRIPSDEPFALDAFSFDFNPAKLSLMVSRAGGSPKELDLGRAVYRHVLRVGVSAETESPTLLVEKRYHQAHAVTAHIEEEQRELLGSFRRACGLEAVSGPVEFPASRNSGGTMSDAVDRICIGDYRFEPLLRPNWRPFKD